MGDYCLRLILGSHKALKKRVQDVWQPLKFNFTYYFHYFKPICEFYYYYYTPLIYRFTGSLTHQIQAFTRSK